MYLTNSNFVKQVGKTRSIKYLLTDFGMLHNQAPNGEYYKLTDEQRNPLKEFNLDIFTILGENSLFSDEEIIKLNTATSNFQNNAMLASPVLHKK